MTTISHATIREALKTAGTASTIDWLVADGHAKDRDEALAMIERALQD